MAQIVTLEQLAQLQNLALQGTTEHFEQIHRSSDSNSHGHQISSSQSQGSGSSETTSTTTTEYKPFKLGDLFGLFKKDDGLNLMNLAKNMDGTEQ